MSYKPSKFSKCYLLARFFFFSILCTILSYFCSLLRRACYKSACPVEKLVQARDLFNSACSSSILVQQCLFKLDTCSTVLIQARYLFNSACSSWRLVQQCLFKLDTCSTVLVQAQYLFNSACSSSILTQ